MYSQTTDTILMIEPVAFGYNDETAVNNHFMQKDNLPAADIQAAALSEFQNMVKTLRSKGINVIVELDTPVPHTPDSIFPNNWLSFQKDNRVAIYPMFAPSRRAERRIEIVERVIGHGFNISQMVDYSVYENENRFLEGTGSMILDRTNRVAYAALSPRTDAQLFQWFCNDFGYKPITFNATNSVEGNPTAIYHTNVMLSVAENFVVICMESVENKAEREMLEEQFRITNKQIFEISLEQMKHFAGNVLQVKNADGKRFLVISQSGYNSLNDYQRTELSSYNELIVIPVPTIEKYGGGSVRCMMAEVY